jgi:hypothetical protein
MWAGGFLRDSSKRGNDGGSALNGTTAILEGGTIFKRAGAALSDVIAPRMSTAGRPKAAADATRALIREVLDLITSAARSGDARHIADTRLRNRSSVDA